MPGTPNRRLTVIALLCLLALGGCSAVGFFYDRADSYLTKRVRDYLKLNAEQTGAIATALQTTHERHRRNELPYYVAYLDFVNSRTEGALDGESAETILEYFGVLYTRLAAEFVVVLSPVLVTLDTDQIAQLEERNRKYNEEQEKEYRTDTPEKMLAARIERHSKSYRFWLGNLSREQQALIRKNAEGYPSMEPLWAEWRQTQQQTLISMLQNRSDSKTLGRFLYGWWADGGNKPQALTGAEKAARERTIKLTLAIFGIIEPRQRNHLQKKLDDYARSLERLLPDDIRRNLDDYRLVLEENRLQLSAVASCFNVVDDNAALSC